jgi:protein-S-isoprenylcysteine O-methyltransferase Ste14
MDKMETSLHRNSPALEYNKQAAFARSIKMGLISGLAGTLVMELVLMGALFVVGMPALTCLSFIGDTVAQLVAKFGIYLADGVPMCLAAQYLIGAIFGVIFATMLSKVSALHINSLKKVVLLSVVYAEIISQPLLAMTTILLKMSIMSTMLWYSASFVMHFLYGITLGAIVSFGLRSTNTISSKQKERTMMKSQSPWWKGTHGEWYVVTQFMLIALVIFGPRTFRVWPTWRDPFTWLSSIGGGILLLAGSLLFLVALFRLGSNLAAVPYPKEKGALVETGPYRLVRHPMYCGIILIAFGWAFLVHGWITLGYAMVLFVFFDIKSRREEQWLKAKFSAYAAYQKRVRKLIPFVY